MSDESNYMLFVYIDIESSVDCKISRQKRIQTKQEKYFILALAELNREMSDACMESKRFEVQDPAQANILLLKYLCGS